jgi:quercetin dioxygenase-like cupin family protein
MSRQEQVPATFALAAGEGRTTAFGGAEIAGHTVKGDGSGELLVLGTGTMLVRLQLRKGFDQDGHLHPEHESIGHILSGRVEMQVGDDKRELGPGSTWYHPRGVHHTCKALEDAEILEFHAPLRPDVLALFGLR